MKAGLKDGITTFYAKTKQAWREWLEKNSENEKSVWLIMYKKDSGTPSINYDEALEEALCFGWIDSKSNKRDDKSFYRFFAKRNPKSKWSKINKEKVERLTAAGLMKASGLAAIELAKQTGTWTALDEVEQLIIPEDLQQALEKNADALKYFTVFPRSAKRAILVWIADAKLAATRQKRITETVQMAATNIRANQYSPKSQ